MCVLDERISVRSWRGNVSHPRQKTTTTKRKEKKRNGKKGNLVTEKSTFQDELQDYLHIKIEEGLRME